MNRKEHCLSVTWLGIKPQARGLSRLVEVLFPIPRLDQLQEYIVSGIVLALYVDSDRTAAVPRYIKVYLKKKKAGAGGGEGGKLRRGTGTGVAGRDAGSSSMRAGVGGT